MGVHLKVARRALDVRAATRSLGSRVRVHESHVTARLLHRGRSTALGRGRAQLRYAARRARAHVALIAPQVATLDGWLLDGNQSVPAQSCDGAAYVAADGEAPRGSGARKRSAQRAALGWTQVGSLAHLAAACIAEERMHARVGVSASSLAEVRALFFT